MPTNSVRSLIVLNVPIDGRAIGTTANQEKPRKDYLLLEEALQGELLPAGDSSRQNGFFSRVSSFVSQAWKAFRMRNDYDVILSMSEQTGLVLALMLKLARSKTRHVMISHYVTPGRKKLLLKQFKVHTHIDKIICYGTKQASFLEQELGVPADKISVVLHPVDASFWSPTGGETRRRIVSAGMLHRDFETLIKAVEGLDVEVRIAAASPWVYSDQEVTQFEVPDNVEFVKCNPIEMRELYNSAQMIAVPLFPVNIQAGSLVIYESMAMGKAVVATANGGNADIVRDGETGIYVPPMDADAMREAIKRLLDDPELSQEMGDRARAIVEQGLNIDIYVKNIADIVLESQPSEDALAKVA